MKPGAGAPKARAPAVIPRQPAREGRGRFIDLRGRYTDFLPEREAISGRQHSPLATLIVLTVTLFVFLFLLWAGFSQVEQFAIAGGQVRPDGRVKVINHPDGGRIADILVREGDMVKAGQVLFRLDPELLQTEVVKTTGQWQQFAADTARLEAEAANAASIAFPAALRAERPDLVANQTRLFEARRAALAGRRDGADRQIEQRSSDVSSLTQQVANKKTGTAMLAQQERSLHELADKGYFPWLRYQSVLRELNDAQGEVARLEAALTSARSALAEARARRKQIDDDWSTQLYGDLAKSRTDRDQAAGVLAQATTRLRNLVIVSPDEGIAQALTVNNIGQAIKPLEPLLNVVPVSDSLVIEAKVANQDIGFITVGQPARVKVRTFDFSKYGTLDGYVEQVSPDGFVDQQSGQVFYKVMVRTDRAWLGPGKGERPVTPGMQVDVDMITGHRSILSYLTDRMFAITSNALREH